MATNSRKSRTPKSAKNLVVEPPLVLEMTTIAVDGDMDELLRALAALGMDTTTSEEVVIERPVDDVDATVATPTGVLTVEAHTHADLEAAVSRAEATESAAWSWSSAPQ